MAVAPGEVKTVNNMEKSCCVVALHLVWTRCYAKTWLRFQWTSAKFFKIPQKATDFFIWRYCTRSRSSGVHTVSEGFLKVKGWSYSPLGHWNKGRSTHYFYVRGCVTYHSKIAFFIVSIITFRNPIKIPPTHKLFLCPWLNIYHSVHQLKISFSVPVNFMYTKTCIQRRHKQIQKQK